MAAPLVLIFLISQNSYGDRGGDGSNGLQNIPLFEGKVDPLTLTLHTHNGHSTKILIEIQSSKNLFVDFVKKVKNLNLYQTKYVPNKKICNKLPNCKWLLIDDLLSLSAKYENPQLGHSYFPLFLKKSDSTDRIIVYEFSRGQLEGKNYIYATSSIGHIDPHEFANSVEKLHAQVAQRVRLFGSQADEMIDALFNIIHLAHFEEPKNEIVRLLHSLGRDLGGGMGWLWILYSERGKPTGYNSALLAEKELAEVLGITLINDKLTAQWRGVETGFLKPINFLPVTDYERPILYKMRIRDYVEDKIKSDVLYNSISNDFLPAIGRYRVGSNEFEAIVSQFKEHWVGSPFQTTYCQHQWTKDDENSDIFWSYTFEPIDTFLDTATKSSSFPQKDICK